MVIQYDTSRPIYRQIIEYIMMRIASGHLGPGEKLPSQRRLARELDVNPNTVQRAYREMENQDLVETRRGLGTFVTESDTTIKEKRRELSQEIVAEFLQQIKSLGYSTEEAIALLEECSDEVQ